MKSLLLVASVATLALVGCNKADLKSDKGQASYAIGQQIGKNLKAQNIEIDPATLAASLKDAAAGKSEMKDDEIQKAMMKLQEGAMKLRDLTTTTVKDTLTQVKTKANQLKVEMQVKAQDLGHQGQELLVKQLENVSHAAEAGKKAIQGSDNHLVA